jgi:phosphoglycolate phosphatase
VYEAIIFDLDGTLLDTLEDLATSMNTVLAEMDLPVHDVDAYRRFIGDGLTMLARRVLPSDRADDDALVDRCVVRMNDVYAANWCVATRPYPGIADMLDRLTELGVRMAVLSNKPHAMTRTLVAALLGDWVFERVEGARPGVARKPDPGMALDVAASLGTAPKAVVYLGDTDTDMRTAVGAEMHAIGALWGFRGAEELTSAGAASIAAAPCDVIALFR